MKQCHLPIKKIKWQQLILLLISSTWPMNHLLSNQSQNQNQVAIWSIWNRLLLQRKNNLDLPCLTSEPSQLQAKCIRHQILPLPRVKNPWAMRLLLSDKIKIKVLLFSILTTRLQQRILWFHMWLWLVKLIAVEKESIQDYTWRLLFREKDKKLSFNYSWAIFHK